MPSETVVNEEIAQDEQQPGPSRQGNNLVELSDDESSDEKKERWWFCLQNLQYPLDGTDGEM